MAQATLKARAFRGAPKTSSDTKNIADLIVAKGTNEAGKVTNPEVYQTAIGFLKDGRDVEELDIDIQKKIAGYENDLKSLNNRKLNQKRTVDDFRRIKDANLFNDSDDSFRDLPVLLEDTILENDRILSDVLDAIESKLANDEDVDDLEKFSEELSQTIDELDDFRGQLVSGEFTPGKKTFDTFTYVVNSDPDGQGIKGATIMPTRLLPKGYQRTRESVAVNGAYIPVAIPTTIDKKGKIYGSLGGQIYKASDTKTPLNRGASEKPGTFNLLDQTIYPKKKSGIPSGAYAQGTIGYDEGGNEVLGLIKRGNDGKLYRIDGDTLERLRGDFEENNKLSGYIDTLNIRDFTKLYGEAKPYTIEQVAPKAPQGSFRVGDFGAPMSSRQGTPELQTAASTPSYFGDRVNRGNKPEEPKGEERFLSKAKGFFSSIS